MASKSNGNGGTGTDLVLRVAGETGFSETQLELIRNVAAKDCTENEIAQLLIMAQRTGLDPLAKQIYMIKRSGRGTLQTGIDGYRLIADRTDRYAPGREPSFAYDDQGGLWSATAYVKKFAGGMWHEVAATAFWNEYAQTKKEGGLTDTWAKMPHVMLAKCAEALALRRAFPAELSGVYVKEEMDQADSEPLVIVEPSAPICSDCPREITRHGNYTAEQLIGLSRHNYGRQLCYGCSVKERKRREEPVEAEYRDAEEVEADLPTEDLA
jgi:phage recombination protein Bet